MGGNMSYNNSLTIYVALRAYSDKNDVVPIQLWPIDEKDFHLFSTKSIRAAKFLANLTFNKIMEVHVGLFFDDARAFKVVRIDDKPVHTDHVLCVYDHSIPDQVTQQLLSVYEFVKGEKSQF